MTDRRRFLRQASVLASIPWAKASLDSERAAESSTAEEPTSQTKTGGLLVLENSEMRLVIHPGGWAQSLVHKLTGQECLAVGVQEPMFTVTQYRPYDNELQLAYPAKITSFPAQNVRRDGDNLIVTFAQVGYEGTISTKVTDAYIAFRLERLEYNGYTPLRPKWKTPIDETLFLQLPVNNRKNFGEWLNVTWDHDVAVNVLGTDHYARIDAHARRGYHLLQAGTVRTVQLESVGAALIVTKTSRLLDRIARVEEDFDLPRGVESRQRKEYKYSYYEVLDMSPANADRHIHFAKMGGFRTMDIYYRAFATAGHFNWRPDYPNGMSDLMGITAKISSAGMIPGFHIHYTKVDKTDSYVTPVPDPRLNLTRVLTLVDPIDTDSTTITVEENLEYCPMEEGRRFLRVADEVIEYENFTLGRPYQFRGCRRAALGTGAGNYKPGEKIGLLDVSHQTNLVLITQDTDIEHEIAARLGEIYRSAGFRFIYYDGAQDVPPPYWFTVSRPQWTVYQQWDPVPLWGEGACKSHFSWHILTRGNAFDVFKPEVMKATIRAYPASEIQRVSKDFTRINFGWIGYWAPSEQTIGDQPDMLEYVTSRAAGWGCPIALLGDLQALEAHPRTADNLEVLKRWEDVRATDWLSLEQKMALRDLDQEYTLLINEQGKFELVPCGQIERVAGADKPGRAFVFERHETTYVVFWHTSGEGQIEVPLRESQVSLMRELGKPVKFKGGKESVTLPLGNKMYLECLGVSRPEAVVAFQKARIFGV